MKAIHFTLAAIAALLLTAFVAVLTPSCQQGGNLGPPTAAQVEALKEFYLSEIDLFVAIGKLKPERAAKMKADMAAVEASIGAVRALWTAFTTEVQTAPPPAPAEAALRAAVEANK